MEFPEKKSPGVVDNNNNNKPFNSLLIVQNPENLIEATFRCRNSITIILIMGFHMNWFTPVDI